MHKGFSIIICTYNPNQTVLSKLLNSLVKLQIPRDLAFEIIIVDNNSSVSISELSEINAFLQLVSCNNVSIIKEQKPGLTNARIAGIRQSNYDWLIFFDDDNEPQANYLLNLKFLINNYENVGSWGPGVIDVQYLSSKVNSWFESNKEIFQQRNVCGTQFDNSCTWSDFYPYGTGLCVKRCIATDYLNGVLDYKFTLTDRTKKALTSGGDTQLVLVGIKKGYFAGSSDLLKLHHNIEDRKIDIRYILKQIYSTTSSYLLAHNEVFNDSKIKTSRVSSLNVIFILYSIFRIYYKKLHKYDFKILIAKRLGELNANVLASKYKQPLVLKVYEKIIDV